VAAIDIDKNKVGLDLSEAVFTKPNNTVKFSDVPKKDVKVVRGMTHDGLGKYLSQIITKAPGPTADIVGILKETQGRRRGQLPACRQRRGDQVVRRADPHRRLRHGELHPRVHRPRPDLLAEALRRGRRADHRRRHQESGRATIVHRVLTRLMRERGVKLERTSQLNVGGNTDFLNMLERERLESKKISKTNAVTSQLDYDMGADNVHIGPSDYVKWLDDRKWAYIRMEGRTFGDVPLQHRAQARGRGLAEQRRHRDRRGALRQDRPRPRVWPARSRVPAATS